MCYRVIHLYKHLLMCGQCDTGWYSCINIYWCVVDVLQGGTVVQTSTDVWSMWYRMIQLYKHLLMCGRCVTGWYSCTNIYWCVVNVIQWWYSCINIYWCVVDVLQGGAVVQTSTDVWSMCYRVVQLYKHLLMCGQCVTGWCSCTNIFWCVVNVLQGGAVV